MRPALSQFKNQSYNKKYNYNNYISIPLMSTYVNTLNKIETNQNQQYMKKIIHSGQVECCPLMQLVQYMQINKCNKEQNKDKYHIIISIAVKHLKKCSIFQWLKKNFKSGYRRNISQYNKGNKSKTNSHHYVELGGKTGSLSIKNQIQAGMSTFTAIIQYLLEGLSRAFSQEKEIREIQIRKEEVKLFLLYKCQSVITPLNDYYCS